MVQNLAIQFLKKAILYGLVPAFISFLTYAAAFKPEHPDQITAWVFTLIQAGCVGIIALLKRLLTYDAEKAAAGK